ncbi:L-serine ammonia-lyase, iron-sulfur-dependent, subunit beta [Erysipelothrix sp. HDW6C]|uniref:L-serine ammonia-lyase, iron-sulfur-dependent subunit beta n=1 Tax=Erysipelothrix sp. HDW6C TaxID=2714930 RepID=UPI00140AA437|nr:L-serine ammonia-lyase, iron-sulfur-dependent subunit beta [Erysipelothrix sp. HDW6C]QIK69641.1 L-serine ammonia-lyase, iron-sulfur-dependent, subunit beta [Erysipelothrix sp. HDW6C]
MAKQNYKSVFDIIGPVMAGPSSSHTAGAARIGKIARNIFSATPESANVYLYESFADTYRGHGTDVALAAGLMGMEPDDDRLHESLLIAQEIGFDIRFIPLAEKVDHPNTAKIVMRSGDRKMSVVGVSIGGGNIKVVAINDIAVDIDGGTPTILIFHIDCPGMIANVARVLSDLHINIGSMKVDREEKGKRAYMVIELDQDELHTSLQSLRELDNILEVLYIRK